MGQNKTNQEVNDMLPIRVVALIKVGGVEQNTKEGRPIGYTPLH